MNGTGIVGTVTHEGVTSSSNTMSADQIRESLGITSPAEPVEDPPSTEPETPAEPATPVDESATTGTQPSLKTDQRASEAPKKKDPQARIDKVIFEREEARRETQRIREESDRRYDAIQRELETLKRQPKPDQPTAKTQPAAGDDPEPKLEDFSDQADPYAAWMRASARWDARNEFKAQTQRARESYERSQQDQRQQQREQHEHSRLNAFHGRMVEAFDRHPDLQAMLESPTAPQLTRPMMDAIVDSDIPDQLSRHLVEHPEEADRIRGLHPLQQFRAMSRLEYQLETAATTTGSAAPAKPKTSAQPPISPVSGTHAAPSSGPPDPKTCTQEEFDAYWNADETAKRSSGRR